MLLATILFLLTNAVVAPDAPEPTVSVTELEHARELALLRAESSRGNRLTAAHAADTIGRCLPRRIVPTAVRIRGRCGPWRTRYGWICCPCCTARAR